MQHIQQVLSVTAALQRLGMRLELRRADIAHAPGDLLDAGHLQALALLDGLDEGGRLQQRLVRTGIQPGGTAAELLDEGLGDLLGCGRDDDRIERCVLGPPRVAVALA